MATTTYLSNPVVTVNSIDLTDQSRSATLNVKYDALESTAFGGTSRVFTAGLGDHEFMVDLLMSYAATETYSTLASLVGTTTTVTVKPTSAVTSAVNPLFTLTGTFLEVLPVMDAKYGELAEISITFKGGTYSVTTS
jgi:hypothetical protein